MSDNTGSIPPEILAQLEEMGATGSGPAPIGVPTEVMGPDGTPVPYQTPYTETTGVYSAGRGHTWERTVYGPPTFYEGDQIGFLFSMRPDQIAAVQQQLSAAGLLDPDSYSPGFVGGGNDPTVAAVSVVMGYANRAGFRDFSAALNAYIEGGFGGVGSQGYAGNAARRLPAPVSNPDDLKRVFKAAVIDTLGTGWSEQQIDALVANYQVAERTFNERVAAGEQVDTQLPTPETFAIQQATGADPTAAAGQDFLGAADQFFSMIGRWGG